MSIWGEDYDKRDALFQEKVKEIEIKYFDLFKDRVNRVTGKAPDQLEFQFITSYNGNAHSIGFLKDTYVPEYVRNEVIQVHNQVWSTI